jgi:hypothetical protein
MINALAGGGRINLHAAVVNLKALIPPCIRHQHCRCTGADPRIHAIAAAGEDNRKACAQHNASRRGIAKKDKLLGQHDASFKIRYQENISVARDLRTDALDAGGFLAHGIVVCKRASRIAPVICSSVAKPLPCGRGSESDVSGKAFHTEPRPQGSGLLNLPSLRMDRGLDLHLFFTHYL